MTLRSPALRPGPGVCTFVQENIGLQHALYVSGHDFSVCPKGADYQWGKDPLEQLMVRFDSWRAVWSGNWPDRNLVTKSTLGGRATGQAVTRVKLEQASKSPMWCRPGTEAGKAGSIRKNPARERAISITTSTDRTTGVVSTACQEGSLRQ